MSGPERVIELADRVSSATSVNLNEIKQITRSVKMLALNALIEASRVGEVGRGFAVVAGEVRKVSSQITRITGMLEEELVGSARELAQVGRGLTGGRLADLSLNMIEIIDRNLYERSCDVRWWATDDAVVECAVDPTPVHCRHASERLAVILSSYTVYLDLWIADRDGRVIANGRPDRYPQAVGTDVSHESWFSDALATQDGTAFTVADIERNRVIGKPVAAYATAIRRDGETHGAPVGVLGIFFDWEPQAQAVVAGVRLGEQEKNYTRCLLVDSRHRVIAASDGVGVLTETFPLATSGRAMGHYKAADDSIVSFALTPGYETYTGLGWYGVITQRLP
jgi:hypothetical protein